MNKNDIVKWTGTVLIGISAVIVSVSPHFATQPLTFVGYCIGAVIWLYYAIKSKEWSLAALNFFYLIIDLWAIFIRL